ncbi:MAG: hypothetical protein AAF224_07495 [Pseudomonadota bacterium]
MTETKFDELKTAIHAYGEAAFQNLVRCRALGGAIVDGLPAYLGCEARCVSAVPAEGAFDPRKDYGDEAFSYAHRDVIVLEPVRFGVSLIVGNAEDAGALWLRTIIAAEMIGNEFTIFVSARPKVRVPLDFTGKLEPVFDAIHQEFLETFTREVMEFNDSRFENGIGFLPV